MRWTLPPIGITAGFRPNRSDLLLIPLGFAVLALLAQGGADMARPFDLGQPPPPLSLDPARLPEYLLASVMRMGAALRLSLAFTLIYATLAAKLPRLERVLIPLLDVLQSIPVLGYLSITVTGFVALFPGSRLGLECAAIFAVFTSQAWNMAFSLYSSLKTVPPDLTEAARMLHLSPWQRFWRLDMPWAMPGLVWNMMMSVSGGWFFVVASEAISVSGQTVLLPGIGSYIAVAVEARDLAAIGWAVAAVLAGVLIYDQLMFRPLVAWADKFKSETVAGEAAPESWLLTLMQRARLPRAVGRLAGRGWEAFAGLFRGRADRPSRPVVAASTPRPWLDRLDHLVVVVVAVLGVLALARLVAAEVGWAELLRVAGLGLATMTRVLVLVALASLVWVPVGVWIGQRPGFARDIQWLAQFLAAFPANLVFPLVVMAVVRFDLNVDVWTSPLMILGTQWYILFNVIAGASGIPRDLKEAAGNLGVTGWLKWRRLILPAIFPAYVTGVVTAAGGSWNAAIVSEWVSWGDTRLEAHGLGAYIARATADGDFPRVALGIAVMCLLVMAINRGVWRRLHLMAEERLRLD